MKKLFKFVLILIVIIIVLSVAVYFVATNSFMIKNVILPFAGRQMGAKISVQKVVISPFRGDYIIKDLKMDAPNRYSVNIGDFNCNLSLFDLIEGTVKISHLNLINSDIHVFQRVPKEEAETQKTEVSKKSKSSLGSMRLDINNVKIKNFNIEYVIERKTKSKTSIIEIKDFNLAIPKLKTETDGRIYYSGVFHVGSAAKEQKLTGLFSGQIYTVLSQKTMPELMKLDSKVKFANNVTPIKAQFTSRSNQALHTQPFSLNLNITDFPLLPLFKAFVEGSLSGSKGNLEDLSLKVNGSDLANVDIYSNINGQLKVDVKDLSLPIVLTKYDLLRIIFLPIEVLANINQYTESNVVPPKLENVFKSANNITSGLNEMQFAQTNADISMNKGIININNFQMKGGKASAVRSISMQGVVDLNNEIDVKTKTSILGLVLPIRIKGTVEKPKPDLGLLLPGAVVGTVKNIVSTGADIGKDVVENGKKTIKKAIKQPETNNKESKGDNIIEGTTKLINNIFSKGQKE